MGITKVYGGLQMWAFLLESNELKLQGSKVHKELTEGDTGDCCDCLVQREIGSSS